MMKPIKKDFQKEVAELKAGWQRTMADFDNFRKRTDEEKQVWRAGAQEELILALLPILDNFDRAARHLTDEQKKDPAIAGMLHIQKQLNDALANYGVTKIDIKVGDEFDANLHEAVDSEGGQGGTKITQLLQSGYQMGAKVLRPARVVVKK
jgi:molecular chaperone GrpE